MLTSDDLQTAIKILRTLPKGTGVLSFIADESGIAAELSDGSVLTLKRPQKPIARHEGLLPFHENAADLILPSPATATPEVPAPAPVAPTVMAHKSGLSFEPTFKMIRTISTLSGAAKVILAELERAELRIGDDVLLSDAGKKAARGDDSALRDLLEKRRRPVERAAAPPH